MATTKKAAKSAKKAPQPTKKAPAKKAAVKPVAKAVKKAAPAKAAPKKAAPKKAAPPAKAKSAPAKGPVSKAVPAKAGKPVPKAAPAKAAPPAKSAVKAIPVKAVVPAKKGAVAPLPKSGAKAPVPPAKAPLAPVKTVVASKGAPLPVKGGLPVKGVAPVKGAAPVKPPVVAPKPIPPAIKPSTVGVKPVEVKSTVIARPVPKPVAKLVELKPIKTSVATTVKYEPDFTKSVLDDPGQTILNAPTMRYSDAELGEFKDLIMRKLEAAKKELTYLQGLITRKDEMGGDESENRYMTMEDGSISMEREQLSQMASRQIQFIDHLEKALMRIENKTYGICRVTGKLIDKARLRAVPHATLSIEAKMGLVKKSENQNVQ
jgi:RNA polymerase-binding transcription factor DksA